MPEILSHHDLLSLILLLFTCAIVGSCIKCARFCCLSSIKYKVILRLKSVNEFELSEVSKSSSPYNFSEIISTV